MKSHLAIDRMRASVTLPLRLVSEANAHTHWKLRQQRAKDQRSTTALVLRSKIGRWTILPCEVTITRIASRAMDSDNAVGAAKHVRDGVADFLGVDDRDPRVTWTVRQERSKPKEFAVRIDLEASC